MILFIKRFIRFGRVDFVAGRDDFFSLQGLFGRKYIIAPEFLADMVYNWVQYTGESDDKANERTARFLNMISEPNRRLFYAEKFQNFDVAIDVKLGVSLIVFAIFLLVLVR